MTDYEAYRMYLALRAHFQTDDYDVVASRGRIRARRSQFTGGKVYTFARLARDYTDSEICNFMVANFVAGNHWGGVFDASATQNYTDWQRRNQSLRYMFQQELQALFNEAQDQGVNNVFAAEPGQHPLVVRAYLRRTIGPETLVILQELTGWANDMELPRDVVWQNLHRLMIKYRPFVRFDRIQFQDILDEFTAHQA